MVESPRTGRLVSFTLDEVPLEIRLAAVRGARIYKETESHGPEDRLMAALHGDVDDPMRAAAVRPSARRYWIPAAAFERVVGISRT